MRLSSIKKLVYLVLLEAVTFVGIRANKLEVLVFIALRCLIGALCFMRFAYVADREISQESAATALWKTITGETPSPPYSRPICFKLMAVIAFFVVGTSSFNLAIRFSTTGADALAVIFTVPIITAFILGNRESDILTGKVSKLILFDLMICAAAAVLLFLFLGMDWKQGRWPIGAAFLNGICFGMLGHVLSTIGNDGKRIPKAIMFQTFGLGMLITAWVMLITLVLFLNFSSIKIPVLKTFTLVDGVLVVVLGVLYGFINFLVVELCYEIKNFKLQLFSTPTPILSTILMWQFLGEPLQPSKVALGLLLLLTLSIHFIVQRRVEAV